MAVEAHAHILCTTTHSIDEMNHTPHCAICGLPFDLWEVPR